LRFVNGTIGNVVAVNRFVDENCIDSIKIVISDDKEIIIIKVDIKFEIFHKMVQWKQFPFSWIYLSYGITIQKVNELRVKMMDVGTSVFSDSQT